MSRYSFTFAFFPALTITAMQFIAAAMPKKIPAVSTHSSAEQPLA